MSAELADHHRQVRQARSVIVVGGGASAVSAAANIAAHSLDTKVDLYFVPIAVADASSAHLAHRR